jgi:hypothetical protein
MFFIRMNIPYALLFLSVCFASIVLTLHWFNYNSFSLILRSTTSFCFLFYFICSYSYSIYTFVSVNLLYLCPIIIFTFLMKKVKNDTYLKYINILVYLFALFIVSIFTIMDIFTLRNDFALPYLPITMSLEIPPIEYNLFLNPEYRFCIIYLYSYTFIWVFCNFVNTNNKYSYIALKNFKKEKPQEFFCYLLLWLDWVVTAVLFSTKTFFVIFLIF